MNTTNLCRTEREYHKTGYLLKYQTLLRLNNEYYEFISQLEKEFNDPTFGQVAKLLSIQLTNYIENRLREHAEARLR